MLQTHTLKNGLRIVAEHLPYIHSVAVGLFVHTGSVFETEDEGGISHFMEHMLFKGTERRSARRISEDVEGVGGIHNAFTSKEYTCFHIRVIDEYTELAMDVLSDTLLHSKFDPAEMEKEKDVVIEEIAMSEDDPEDLCGEKVMEALYGKQPIALPILGTAEKVKSFTREQMLAYRKTHYRPDNSVLCIVGNIDFDNIVALSEKYFGEWEASAPVNGEYPYTGEHPSVIRIEKPIEQVHISIAYPAFKQSDSRSLATALFNNSFGGAGSSRLFQTIREENGMAYSVGSYSGGSAYAGSLIIYLSTTKRHVKKALKLIDDEIADVLKNGITEAEFSMSRNQFRGNLALGAESSSNRMQYYGGKLICGLEVNTLDERLERLNRVTLEQVNAVAKECLSGVRAAAFVGNGADSIEFR